MLCGALYPDLPGLLFDGPPLEDYQQGLVAAAGVNQQSEAVAAELEDRVRNGERYEPDFARGLAERPQ